MVESDNRLLSSLNSTCILPATDADIKALDLYNALSSMPKNVDTENDAIQRDDVIEIAAHGGEINPSENPVKTQGRGRKGHRGKHNGAEGELTQRELGRLKNKKALLAKLQQQQQGKLEKPSEDSAASTPKPGEEEREIKKAKVDDVGATMDES